MLGTCGWCGDVFEVRKAEVDRGNGRFCSLSCVAKDNNSHRPQHGRKRLTYSEQKKKYKKRFLITGMAGGVQGRCRKRNQPCDLTPSVFRAMWEQQGGKCYYSGADMTMGNSTLEYHDMDQVSIDRVVPSKGYTKGNMVLCCHWTNTAKGQDDILRLMERINGMVKYQERK